MSDPRLDPAQESECRLARRRCIRALEKHELDTRQRLMQAGHYWFDEKVLSQCGQAVHLVERGRLPQDYVLVCPAHGYVVFRQTEAVTR